MKTTTLDIPVIHRDYVNCTEEMKSINRPFSSSYCRAKDLPKSTW